jgi:DNA-directed RNA polymerase specialized sigma24 family protein
MALDDALNALARVDPRNVRVVEMHFFAGLSVEETAMVLRLYRELTGDTDDGLGSLDTAR